MLKPKGDYTLGRFERERSNIIVLPASCYITGVSKQRPGALIGW